MGPATCAVDVPRRRIDLEIGKRRHRRVTGPAGLLLFICMFLPAVKGCNETVYPVTMPMFWHPYVFGAVFAFGAHSLTTRGLRYTVVALRVLAWLAVIGAALLTIAEGPFGLLEMAVGVALVFAIGTRGYCERRIAATAIVVGACSLLWFALWCGPDALVGVYLSVPASAGLLVGGLVWLGELSSKRIAPIALPRALAREHE